MIVLDMAIRQNAKLSVFTLDTGRLPEETYSMIETVRRRYGVTVESVAPDANELGRMIDLHGPNLFRNDRPSRMLCCQVRKVRPLARKLAGFAACLSGLRRGQSDTRADIEQVEETYSPAKINPLAYWSALEMEAYMALHNVPVHPLYARGYTSIGCEPCTRATSEGEDVRAGRWWWEDEAGEAGKECGIHFTPDGRAQRTVDVLLSDILNHA